MNQPQPSVGKYIVVRPGKTLHEFEMSKDAVEFLVRTPGYAKVYGPNGGLILTKGAPAPVS